jgi:site-specific DNA recombinase
MKAAIYCRVSTEDQEREGTSLQSQKEACLKKAHELGYEVPEELVFIETCSGLTLERPELTRLRELIRNREIEGFIAYTLDRLSRDPVHFIILQDELDRAGVGLILVTETIDSSDLGKLITYIKGYAAKLETEKIRERTMRGLKERAKTGKFPSGRRARLYGYTYLPGKSVGEGVRYINEAEVRWVRQIFDWYVNEGLGKASIVYKLRSLGVPTPSGKGLWHASEVWKILKNRAYIGETYVFTETRGEPKTRLAKGFRTRKTRQVIRPREEWVELPNATPPIIDKELFEAAQAQLKRNKERAKRNTKHQYLLSGHIRCSRCNRTYSGYARRLKWGGEYHLKRYYRCLGNLQMVSPIRCGNRNLQADKVESLIWKEVEGLLSQPQLVLSELERKRVEVGKRNLVEQELDQVNRRLRALDKEQEQLLQWALKGFPEETVIRENEKFNRQRAELKQRRAELEARIEQAKQSEVDIAGIERFCELVRQNLRDFTFEDKRLALEALRLEVWVDGDTLRVVGSIPVIEGDIVSTRP